MKRVLVCCPVYSPHAGGGGQYFPLLVRQLLKFEATEKVIVVTEYHPERKFYQDENGAHVYRLLPQRDTKTNKSNLYSVLSFFVTYAVLYVAIPVLLMKHKVDVIHYTRYLRIPFYILMAISRVIFGVKVILDMRTTVESDGCILRLFGYSSMISNSMGVFDQMERLGVPKEKHFFVPNPIEFPQKLTFEEAIPVVRDFDIVDGQPYILFVGQLLHRKSIVEVVDAFEIFSATYTDCCLVLVGRNMIGSSIEQKVHRNRKILHIKPVARDKVAALMTCSQMIVQPSRVEGIPRVTLEALSLGKKVLLPPCVPEFKKNNEEFSIKEVSTREIADAMLRIYKTTNSPVYDLSVHDPSESAKVLRDVYTQTYRYA